MRLPFDTLLLLACLGPVQAQPTHTILLDALEVKSFSEGIPAVVAGTNQAGGPLRIGGASYRHGLGFASTAVFPLQLDGKGLSFSATVGVDDAGNDTAVHRFYVVADRRILFESGPMRRGDAPRACTVDLHGVRRLGLLTLVEPATAARAFSDWVDPRITMKGDATPTTVPNTAAGTILTPPDPPAPRINNPAVAGARPGNPVGIAIAATGERPMRFSAGGLPEGLQCDAATGIITGTVNRKGEYPLTLSAENRHGADRRALRLRIGDTIALTPPMGWNGWNSWAREIDRDKVLASARAMVEMGLRDHGWTYVNIDDAWQGPRAGADKALTANGKFPSFAEMADSIHRMGLKLGVYSTPWIASYAGFPGGSSDLPDGAFPDSIRDDKRAYRRIGRYRFEEADARRFAEWGVDYLKYDWRIDLPTAERMAAALHRSGRDIVYSLSNAAPFEMAAEWARVANMFRTGPDIRDSWHALYRTVFSLDPWAPFAGPGHWNDPDMMVLGQVTTGSAMHPTRLTPDEQYSEVSLFALLSAPMLIGCPIDRLDAFTRSLLTNREVIAIDQDPLGSPARLLRREKGVEVWVKRLHDGTQAVGLFHTADYGDTPQSYFRWDDERPTRYRLDLSLLGHPGPWRLRDLWRQHDIGRRRRWASFKIPHHGVILLKVRRPPGRKEMADGLRD